jgi:hypothetical protein
MDKDGELKKIISQLREINRSKQIELACERAEIPIDVLIYVARLWLSENMEDWTAACDTVYQYTSPFGNRQLCNRREPVKSEAHFRV